MNCASVKLVGIPCHCLLCAISIAKADVFCLSQLVWHKPSGVAASRTVRVLWKPATSCKLTLILLALLDAEIVWSDMVTSIGNDGTHATIFVNVTPLSNFSPIFQLSVSERPLMNEL